jgi:hypothetical protein
MSPQPAEPCSTSPLTIWRALDFQVHPKGLMYCGKGERMTDLRAKMSGAARSLCWICNRNEANSGEHKTKRSDLLAVLGKPTQKQPFYFHDLQRQNRPVGSLDAKILKAPIRICTECNTTTTQPHDRAWECMSDGLRARPLKVGQWVRANTIFPYDTRRKMTNVHLYFLKLFGCMLCEAKANRHNVPIDIAPFSQAIITGRPHPEVHLQFGKCDGTMGRSNLHCWTTQQGSVFAGWLYELDTIAVSVLFAQAKKWEHRSDLWHPRSPTGSKRFQIADFMYVGRADADNDGSASNSKWPRWTPNTDCG